MPGAYAIFVFHSQKCGAPYYRRVDGHVELSEEVNAQDGPLHVCCDEGEVALMHG